MLEHYVEDRKTLAAMKRNPLFTYLTEAAARYRANGYFHKYALRSLGLAARFGEWLQKQRITPAGVTEQCVERYLRQLISTSSKKTAWRAEASGWAIHFIMALIPDRVVSPPSPAQVEAVRYMDHLRRNRGLAEGTLWHHRWNLERFLTFCFKRRSCPPSAITAAKIHAYVDGLPHGVSNGQRSRACTAMRGYFRFLQMLGVPVRHLQVAVPYIRMPRTAPRSEWMTQADADQLLRSIDRSTATGKRTYATILCMMDLGMRVGDVARLSLDDIDWDAGTIRVSNHKVACPYPLPLPRRLGKAVADYLSQRRLPSRHRKIFLNHGAQSHGAPVTAIALKVIMARVWERSGMGERFSGTHILRHSMATRMKQEGVGLKVIADVLGHQAMQSVMVYVQVDLPTLRMVAQPWPEVRS